MSIGDNKALASFIIANGAAAYGRQVTIFFTFWGLNVIKRPEKVSVAKRGLERMFDIMLPNQAGQLPIMIAKAQKMDVKMVACTISMDIMGIKEEIIAGVDFGGVATYTGETMDANLNLFI